MGRAHSNECSDRSIGTGIGQGDNGAEPMSDERKSTSIDRWLSSKPRDCPGEVEWFHSAITKIAAAGWNTTKIKTQCHKPHCRQPLGEDQGQWIIHIRNQRLRMAEDNTGTVATVTIGL